MIQTTPVVNIALIDLPTTVAGYSIANDDLSYTIVLNAKLSDDRIRKAYQHELNHIYSDDFEKDDVEMIELMAHEEG